MRSYFGLDLYDITASAGVQVVCTSHIR